MRKAMLIIDIPRCCNECDIVCKQYYSAIKNKNFDNDAKPKDCPLREAPESKVLYGDACDENEYEYEKGYVDGYNSCIDDIG